MSKTIKERYNNRFSHDEEENANRGHRPNHHKQKRLDHALKTKDIDMLIAVDDLEDEEY